MLFAANHVLHRLLPPRHPPSALRSLTINQIGQIESSPVGPRRPFRRGDHASLDVRPPIYRLDKFSFILHIQDALSSERYSTIKDPRIISMKRNRRLHSPVKREHVSKTSCGGLRVFSCLERKTRTKDGGAGRDRTDDLRLAKPALSQLSYGPTGKQRVTQCSGESPAV